ncbi:MAG: SPOR domain-containing protein [Neomegalonema sp.]|nr:SPOR domain-containing protein [Neomegalonema sp.]
MTTKRISRTVAALAALYALALSPVAAEPSGLPGSAANSGVNAKVAAAPREAERPTPGSEGPYFQIQLLASIGPMEEVVKQWRILKDAHPDLLAGLELDIHSVTADGELLHRMRAGAFASQDAARAVCEKFKARGVDCWAPAS